MQERDEVIMAKKLDFDKEKNNRNDNAIEEIMQAEFPLPKHAEDAKNEAFSRIREMAAASGNAENTANMVQRLQEKSTEKSTKKSTEKSTGSSGKKSSGTVKSHKKFKAVYKTVYKTALGLTAAAAVFSAVCITNPAFAENIPLVGNVFKQLGNSLGFSGDYSKYAKQLTDSLLLVHKLTGYDTTEGAGETVGEAIRELARVTQFDEGLAPLEETLTSVDGLLNDFNRELSAYLEDLTFDEGEFYETERRLDLINGLKAKYGRTIEEIGAYCSQQKEKLEKLRRFEENLQEMKDRLAKLEKILFENSDKLSRIRREYSSQLEQKVIQGLKDLNFLDVNFAIDFQRKKSYTDNGFDDIGYLISTNPGESLKPLGQIVSGGELSRIMLALKAILADRDQIETLIFDEIDTGISGRTAQKVSEKMAVIGRNHQVICITHLPQIAAMADSHFEIEKHLRGTETITQIHVLQEEDSIRELARLLGGAEITPAVFENAKEMKELAQKQKNTRLK